MNNSILNCIGNTPLVRLNQISCGKLDIYAKCEFFNPTGSMKDRAAYNAIVRQIEKGRLQKGDHVVESSSGNFGISLANVCSLMDLHFHCVVDPNINPTNEKILHLRQAEVIKVTKIDANRGYLLSRLERVQQFLKEVEGSFWTNQYDNSDVIEGYYGLVDELLEQIDTIDYLFIPVSSAGMLSGISSKLKKIRADVKVIAVDVNGSVIFGGAPKRRYIPGMGSCIVPPNLKKANYDGVVYVDESEIIKKSREVLQKEALLVGGSSIATICAIQKYFDDQPPENNTKIVTIFCDCGERYLETLYCDEWCKNTFGKDVL